MTRILGKFDGIEVEGIDANLETKLVTVTYTESEATTPELMDAALQKWSQVSFSPC